MASSQGGRTRQPTSPPNNAVTGVILVVVAVVIGFYLLAKGGGAAKIDAASGRPSAVATHKSSNETTVPTVPVVTTPIAQLKVVVGNGSGTSGRGNTTRDLLISLGYTGATAENGKKATKTTVYFTNGAASDARGVALALKLPDDRVAAMPTVIPLATPSKLAGASVLVLIGPDFTPGAPKTN